MAFNRLSTMSSVSNANIPRQGQNAQSAQVSTQTLLNALHTSFQNTLPHPLEFSTSLAVNSWLTAQNGEDGRIGGTVDPELAERVWQHARRRAEDGTVVLGSLHESSPSMLGAFSAALPLHLPSSFFTSLEVIRAFTHTVTPFNPSYARYSSLAAQFTLNSEGELLNTGFALSTLGLDTGKGLFHIPAEQGYRAFDVFYYLNVPSASKAEREVLNLKPYSSYSILRRSGTFSPPRYVPTADDAGAAEDFRHNLRSIGIKGPALQNLISALAGILKLGDTVDYNVSADTVQAVCDDACILLDLDPNALRHRFDASEREVFLSGLYEAIVDWVIQHANAAMKKEIKTGHQFTSSAGSGTVTPTSQPDALQEDTVTISVVDIPDPNLGKAVALRTVFDDTQGINAEMKQDGVVVVPAGASVLNEMRTAVAACAAELDDADSAACRERDIQRDRREGILERVAQRAETGPYIKDILHPTKQGVVLGAHGRFHLSNTLNSSRIWFHLNIHPTDESPAGLVNSANHWSAAAVSSQLRAWRLPEWANRRNKNLDFTADFDPQEFVERFSRLGCQDGKEGIETWLLERGWSNGEVVVGESRIWLRESAWWEAECQKDALPLDASINNDPMHTGFSTAPPTEGGYFGQLTPGSQDGLTVPRGKSRPGSLAPTAAGRSTIGGDYGLGYKGDQYKGEVTYEGLDDAEMGDAKVVEQRPVPFTRRLWVALVWAVTFWIPSPLLRYVGRMKRPDVRLAWREKVTLVMLIFLINAIIVFYIIAFGKLLCPGWDKAWNQQEVSYHQGDTDFWVSHRGKVYDLSKFWKTQHSDTDTQTTSDQMLPFAGLNMDAYINPPLTLACPKLVTDVNVALSQNDTSAIQNPSAIHLSGPNTPDPRSKLHNIDWYTSTFLPKMKTFYKGDLVWAKSNISAQGEAGFRTWFIIDNSVYDITNYLYTYNTVQKGNAAYSFFPGWMTDLASANNGADITQQFNTGGNQTSRVDTKQCLDNYFYIGTTDFRQTARCQVNNYILLTFTIILCSVIGIKFLSALQLGSKKRPSPQDKFVICQVPAYTEGEDQLRKGLDSLTGLAYDNKRKLICVICDGVIVGAGNDRPTPKIVLDILGVDPKVDPPALPFKSVGQGSEQLNYGKVYSGLYEFEGNVVPYLVVVKVGKESEQTKPKPGNRGKRDSQILLMSFLNRVHHRSPMSPLELEIFHQINNVIGVDPELYEYTLMVDADTMVAEDSLNRLVAACANDAKIAGICGETSLQNEERSWWTMIQVYEYFISHHLSKAFESLFGSVTCLPGCFCMYRLRTADKGRPLLISDKVIEEYSDGDVDTLHKKNLLSLGEDRYLTTLMTKHFPHMSYKFVPQALAHTAAPETWSVLLSQRRRWINSTIHNLAELVFIKDMCGFCCFSMRFVVFIDLTGTLILPATCAYLGYLFYQVGSHKGQFPLISLIILAAVYGLQAIIFIIKRQWQHIGWMIIYIIAFPIYSFVLPVYSFWKQDDFSWGNTRMVLEEKGALKVVAMDHDDGFDPRSVPLMRWDDYATENNLPGRRGVTYAEKYDGGLGYEDPSMEMDEIRSVVSSVKHGGSMHNFGGGLAAPPYMAGPNARGSTYSLGGASFGSPLGGHGRNSSLGGISNPALRPTSTVYPVMANSTDNLMNPQRSNLSLRPQSTMYPAMSPGSRPVSSVNLLGAERPGSTINFMDGPRAGPSDQDILMAVRECLSEVELERVTKKHVVALAELKLQCQLTGERKNFLYQAIDAELERMPE
ncbi:chitin synthase, class VI [Microthyrium microscopicum]|uniref:chitin synthase n=1 Tax=Microthyrium microscopicum TaxID=703497 RepID=A0A6A6TWU3_9PEZI|nr:chitin synthase, class VI [Microthyrium microscopicum]